MDETFDGLSDYTGLPSGTAEPWDHDMSSTTLVGAWGYTAEVDSMLKLLSPVGGRLWAGEALRRSHLDSHRHFETTSKEPSGLPGHQVTVKPRGERSTEGR